ncbi:MAG: hypothetical protein ACKOB8_02835, partial [Mycobacterium sp.]
MMPSAAPCPALTAARATAARCGAEGPRRSGDLAAAGCGATAVLRAPARSALAAPERCARAGPADGVSAGAPAEGASAVSASATPDPANNAAAL